MKRDRAGANKLAFSEKLASATELAAQEQLLKPARKPQSFNWKQSGFTGGAFVWLVYFASTSLKLNGVLEPLVEHDKATVFVELMNVSCAMTAAQIWAPRNFKNGVVLGLQFLLVHWFLDSALVVPFMVQENYIGYFDNWLLWLQRACRFHIGYLCICMFIGFQNQDEEPKK